VFGGLLGPGLPAVAGLCGFDQALAVLTPRRVHSLAINGINFDLHVDLSRTRVRNLARRRPGLAVVVRNHQVCDGTRAPLAAGWEIGNERINLTVTISGNGGFPGVSG